MKRDLDRLARERFDLAIVGGGIYGVCAAYEASRRGLEVALVERNDFASATSSQSLRIVHGGLRYLQHLDLRRTLDSIAERRELLRLAPHLVEPLPCAMPVQGHGLRGREALALGLWLNERCGASRPASHDPARRLARGRMLSRDEMRHLVPGLDARGLRGGAFWSDAQAWSSERLLLAFLRAATRAGAAVANHVEATGLIRDGSRVEGVACRDAFTEREFELRAALVLNATGPWSDRLLGGRRARPLFAFSKAFNLLVRPLLPHGTAVGLRAVGGQTFFVVPWRGFSLIGTKHLPWEGNPDDFSLREDEIADFVEEVRGVWPASELRREDVLGAFAGMLPRDPRTEAEREVRLQREHALVDHGDGLLSLVGVKWTTARQVAEQAVLLAARKLGRSHAVVRSEPRARLPGGEIDDVEAWLRGVRARRPAGVTAESLDRLARAHGSELDALLELVARAPELGARVHPSTDVIGAEIVQAAREEMACTLDDAVFRRCELHLEWAGRPIYRAALARCADLLGHELGWGPARRRQELERTIAALARFACDPGPSEDQAAERSASGGMP